MYDTWSQLIGSHPARVFALVVGIGILFGGSLPELGNLASYWTQAPSSHFFNKPIMVLGVLGFVISYIALHRG